jgi:hypothetical protein
MVMRGDVNAWSYTPHFGTGVRVFEVKRSVAGNTDKTHTQIGGRG